MWMKLVKNFAAAAIFLALIFPAAGSRAFAEGVSAGEKIGDGINYGGYFFAALGEKLVKIPRGKKKTAANAEFVMDFPSHSYPYETDFFLVDGVLYVNFYAYMSHGGLFRIVSPQSEPELVLDTTGDGNEASSLSIIDSKRDPKGLKFLRFAESDAGRYFWTLYYYLPQRKRTGYLLWKGSVPGELDSFKIMGDDGILDVERDDDNYRIIGVSKLIFDPAAETVRRVQWLPRQNKQKVPVAYDFHLSPDETKLFLLGPSLWVYDIGNGSLKKTFDFARFFPKWPGGYLAYVDESYGTDDLSYYFSWSGNNLRVSRGELAVTINALSGAIVFGGD
jgi:hypothetical protein